MNRTAIALAATLLLSSAAYAEQFAVNTDMSAGKIAEGCRKLIAGDSSDVAGECLAIIATIAGLREVFSEDERFCIPAEVNTVTAIIQTFVDHLDQAPQYRNIVAYPVIAGIFRAQWPCPKKTQAPPSVAPRPRPAAPPPVSPKARP